MQLTLLGLKWLQRHTMAIASVAVITVLVAWFNWGSTPPKQAELVERFFKDKSSFEQLRSMFLEDRLETIGEYGSKFARQRYVWTGSSEAGIAKSRAQTYANLMTATEIKRIDLGDDGSVSLSIARWGMANKGWRISIVSQGVVPPFPQLSSIDDFKKSKHEWEDVYSHIADHWYLHILW